MKKIKSILLSLIFVLTLTTNNVFASSAQISIDDTIIKLDQEPIILNDRVLVPVRFVSEELDYQVKWDNDNQNVYIYDNSTTPKTYKNNTTNIQVYLNNNLIEFPDQKPVIVNSRTLIPLRSVAENMNVSVSWDGTKKLVKINTKNTTDIFAGYRLIEVEGGNLSGNREANVVVDIGYGNRQYYAFTNQYGQLVKVIADEIIIQDDENEPVLSTGRYYRDEAKVPGTELSNYDEGHVIADSLGGVSNAYNITPQESTLNRYGDQAYMEDTIRKAGGATNFVAIITYPNTTTQTPSHYSFTYTLKGNVINDEFDNVNPEK